MRYSLIFAFILCCSCSPVSPPTEIEIKKLLENPIAQPNHEEESGLEELHCRVSEGDKADYECDFLIGGVEHKHFYGRAGGNWRVVYEGGSS
jgi:hypothetical protein